ncbi:MAG: hypothetical protein HUU33_14665 [Flavobacteriales bacterium]|nr:hypothetical protein [Flavobacteriales bacterium]
MDYDVQRFTRHCAVTGRELVEGEQFYSALVRRGADLERLDYSQEGWQGAPADAVGWWKSQVPSRDQKKAQLAPGEVLLDLFLSLADEPDKQDMRFVLALLLVRRRVLRLEQTVTDEQGIETLVLCSPRDETLHRVASVLPDERREAEIQAELSRLLYTQAS